MKTKIERPRKVIKFEFDVDYEWHPGEGNCEEECPFEQCLQPGTTCFAKEHELCPFVCGLEE